MKITWVTRSFLDYRIPVYKALDQLCGNNLTIIFNGDVVPQRCQDKLFSILGNRAIPLRGEFKLAVGKKYNANMANTGLRIPFQKGLIKKIRQSKPDILISDGFFQWTYSALWVRLFNSHKIKHIMCYERTPYTERNAGRIRTLYRKIVSNWIDAIDCNGLLTAKYVRECLNYKKPLALGHMAAEVEGIMDRINKTSIQEVNAIKQDFQTNDLTFLYVGRIIPLKGIRELLNIWKLANIENSTLLLVGDGTLRNEIEYFIQKNNINNVKLTGAINYDDLAPYYLAANCFIIPTLEDNWSLVVPEAMAAGLPIACSIYNGCYPELVKDNGWVFDPLNTQDFINVLHTISQNRNKLKAMGNISREIVSHHTPQIAAQNLFDLCKELVK